MDRQVLTSSRAVQDTSRYAVGILDQNELHITPIEGVLSLRPSMEYLDQSDKTAKGIYYFSKWASKHVQCRGFLVNIYVFVYYNCIFL